MESWTDNRLSKEQRDYAVGLANRNLTVGFVLGFVAGAVLVAVVWTKLGLLQWGCGQ